jgi:WW domain-binding protein 4
MTEYWVSQKQHFCEYCKIFIANNAASKGMHENGLRHKENVAKRLADMRRNNIVEKREKEQMDRDLERIEWKARRQYEKDLAQQSTSGASPAPLGKALSSSCTL